LTVNDDTLRAEINKRFTLNWLIQGAAQHAGITFHHLVRDELDVIDPGLVPLYDQYALINLLQYWSLEGSMLLGRPSRFWRRAATDPKHPFFHHPVLSRHGGDLAAAARQRGRQRRDEKGFWRLRYLFPLQVVRVVDALKWRELGHEHKLIELAKRAVFRVWRIPPDRLDAQLTTNVAFGTLSKPRGMTGRMMRMCAVGYGGVIRRGDTLVVCGRGTNWQLMAKELVKGTAELICLHGLNGLSEDVYAKVIAATDGPHFEPWMLQTGGELWRHLLAVLPHGRPQAQVLMHLALLPAKSLETLILAVLEQPNFARELLASVGESDAERVTESD
jgi:hypothetical protein